MSDLNAPCNLEQVADFVQFLYRDEVYNAHAEQKRLASIIIGKRRNGATGKVVLSFQSESCRFDNCSPDA